MLDKKLLNKDNISVTADKLKSRGYELPLVDILNFQEKQKVLIHECELLRSFNNSYSKARGLLKAYNDEIIKLNRIYGEIKND